MISVINLGRMVQRAWVCVARGTTGTWAAACSSTQSPHRFETTDLGDLGTEESRNPTSSSRAQQAEGRAGFLGEGTQLQGPSEVSPSLTCSPQNQAAPQLGSYTQLASVGCRHHSSSLPPQKDVVHPPQSRPSLCPEPSQRRPDTPAPPHSSPTHTSTSPGRAKACPELGSLHNQEDEGHLPKLNSPQTD